MAHNLWTVSGSFIIPGTRKKGSFGPRRVCASSKQAASKHIAQELNQTYAKDLMGMGGFSLGRFGDNFALMNLQWQEYQASPKVQDADAPGMGPFPPFGP